MTNYDKTKYFKIKEVKKKTSEIVAEMRKLFKVYIYDEENLDKNFPIPKKLTTRYFKRNSEADEEFKNMSANDLEKKGIKGITLRERLLMEIQYFKETGKHLDIESYTLCAGSRYPDGHVPVMDWGSHCGEVRVDWFDSGDDGSSLRVRAAVSLESSSLNPLNHDCQYRAKLEEIKKIIKLPNQ